MNINSTVATAGMGLRSGTTESEIRVDYKKTASNWRLVGIGLNLEAICITNGCEAFNKRVWSHHGTGDFDMLDLVFQKATKCPICKQSTADPINMGFRECRYEVQGQMLKPARKIVQDRGRADGDQFLTFKRENANWGSLNIRVFEN